jgi:hypothetical protein
MCMSASVLLACRPSYTGTHTSTTDTTKIMLLQTNPPHPTPPKTTDSTKTRFHSASSLPINAPQNLPDACQ